MPKLESQVRDNRLCKMAPGIMRIYRYLEYMQVDQRKQSSNWSGPSNPPTLSSSARTAAAPLFYKTKPMTFSQLRSCDSQRRVHRRERGRAWSAPPEAAYGQKPQIDACARPPHGVPPGISGEPKAASDVSTSRQAARIRKPQIASFANCDQTRAAKNSSAVSDDVELAGQPQFGKTNPKCFRSG